MLRYASALASVTMCASLGGCGGEARADRAAPPPALFVETIPAEAITLPKTVRLTGTLEGEKESDVAADASGRVEAVRVEVGQRVRAGDVLVRLDAKGAELSASEARAQASLARSRLTQAERDLARMRALFASQTIAEAELDAVADRHRAAVLEVEAAEARAAQAARTRTLTQVRAPFDGVVAARLVVAGEYVRPDTPVVRLATAERLRLLVDVPEAYLARVPQGAEVRFEVPAHPGRTFVGRVDRRGVMVRSATRDVVVEAPVVDGDADLLSGMFALVDVVVGEEPAVAVPRSALVHRGERRHVFVARAAARCGEEADGARAGGASSPVEPVRGASAPVKPVRGASAPIEPVGRASAPVEPVGGASAPVEPVGRASSPVEPAEAACGTIAEERAVALGPELDGGRIALRRGASAGERVIVAPPAELRNGSPVR